MSYIKKYSEKATVSNGITSITVYGDTAKFISAIAIATALLILFALIAKAIK